MIILVLFSNEKKAYFNSISIILSYIILLNLFLKESYGDEYLIKELNYLQSNFTNIVEDIFPSDFQISVYLTSHSGLLFYSIDKRLNQLIVNLEDTKDPSIIIILREVKSREYIKNICKCKVKTCILQKFTLRFSIFTNIEIQCNGGIVKRFPIGKTNNVDNKYPIPKFEESGIDAYLWVINTPKYENSNGEMAYPNPYFLTGCISDIKYKNLTVNFLVIGTHKKCVSQCKDNKNICNGGNCLETFNSHPVCDCSDTFGSGDFCNSTTLSLSLIPERPLRILSLKLSWKNVTTSTQILKLKNGHRSISINSTNNSTLELVYNNQQLKFTNELIKNHSQSEEHILIITFQNESINTKYKRNNTGDWQNMNIWIKEELTNENFNYIEFLKCNCSKITGSLSYKASQSEIRWLAVDKKDLSRNYLSNQKVKSDFRNYLSKTNFQTCEFDETECSMEKTLPIKHGDKDENSEIMLNIIVGILAFLNFVFLIWIGIICKNRSVAKDYKSKSVVIRLIEDDDSEKLKNDERNIDSKKIVNV